MRLRPEDCRELAILLGMRGCGDHGCHFVRRPGMGTNGGCRCDVVAEVRRALTGQGLYVPPPDGRLIWPEGTDCPTCGAGVCEACVGLGPSEWHRSRWQRCIDIVRAGGAA